MSQAGSAEPFGGVEHGMGSKLSRRTLAGLLLALTCVVYLPVVENGYIWDDDDYVYDNPTLASADGLRRIWLEAGATPQYYPLVHTTYWIENHIWGLDPLGYHIVNVVLHALTALLLWRVLVLLGVPGAWAAAAIFALHPVQVESVAWITERKNVLSGALYLGSMLAYLHWARQRRRPLRLYALAFGLFVCALLSKTVTASLPAVLLVVFWWKRRGFDRESIVSLLPFFAVGILFGIATSLYESHLVGASGRAWQFSAVERGLIAGRALCFYLGKLLWPHPLVFNYPKWAIDSGALWQYAYPAGAAAAGIALFAASGRIGRGAVSAAAIFAGTLLPALGFFDVYPMRYSFVADHFQYLASAAPIALGCATATRVASRLGPHGSRALAGVAAALLAVLAVLTWNQIANYRDAETLWRATLAHNPDSWLSHSSLCSIEHNRGDLAAALPHCDAMLRLEPDNHETHHMLAIVEVSRGNTEAAIRQYRRALEIEPDFPHSLNGLAAVLNNQGRFGESIALLRRLLERHPDYAGAHTNLGNALAAVGELDEAIAQHRRAIELQPGLAAAHLNLAAVLVRTGELELARRHLLRAAELQPDAIEVRRALSDVEHLLGARPR